jgi:hypothetical protein
LATKLSRLAEEYRNHFRFQLATTIDIVQIYEEAEFYCHKSTFLEEIKIMLRRPPTAITLTTEDLIKYDETRAQQIALQRAQAAAAAENTRPAKQMASGNSSAEKPVRKTATDRIMGSGSGR